jgi:hypothetical protein
MALRSNRFEMHFHGAGFEHRGGDGTSDDGIIEGEYSEVPPETVKPAPDRLDKPGSTDGTS